MDIAEPIMHFQVQICENSASILFQDKMVVARARFARLFNDAENINDLPFRENFLRGTKMRLCWFKIHIDHSP